MWELDHKKGWASKNWHFRTVVLEKTLESPLDCKEIQPVYPRGNQSWILIGKTNAEAENPILWPPDAKNWLIWKDPEAGKDWRQEEKRTTEDEMVGWHHWLNGHEFEQSPEVGDGQGSLVCCSPWGCRVGHDWSTELIWLNLPFGVQASSWRLDSVSNKKETGSTERLPYPGTPQCPAQFPGGARLERVGGK